MNTPYRRWLCGALAAAILMLGATGSQAASSRIALVVGDGQYAGQPALPACSKAAHAVSAFLRQWGYTVDESIDGSAVALRDALSDFAGRAAAFHEPALVYVCAEATAVDRRLFVLPSDVDLHQALRPETQGIVLRALLNAMAGTEGTMIAELSLVPGADPAPVTAALQQALPDGLHLALTVGDGKQAGMLGDRVVNNGTVLDQGWNRLAAALQGPPNSAPATVSLYEPPPVPPAVAAPATLSPAASQQGTVLPGAPADKDEAAEAAPPASPPAVQPPEGPQTAKNAPDAKTARTKPAGEERLRRLQAALTRHGFYSGPLDGIADARTVQAILSYQISVGDPPTGTLTQTEIIRMLNNG
jgi:hypothetical protein